MEWQRDDKGRRRLVRAVIAVVLLLLVVASLVILYVVTSRDATEPPTGTAEPTTSAPDEGPVLEQYSGLPAGAEPGETGAVVNTLDGTIHVFTTGSSSCPEVPTGVVVDGDEIVVTVDGDRTGPCTADVVPTTSVVAIPEDYQGVEPPVVRVERAST